MKHPSNLTAVVITCALAVLAVFALAYIAGCSGKATASYSSRKVIVDPDTGREVYRRDVRAGEQQELPPNAAGPTTMIVTEAGVNSSVAGTHEKTADQIIAENGKYFYFAAIGFALLAVVSFGPLKSVPLAAGAGAAAASCALTPAFIDQVGPWLLPIGLLGLLVGGGWYVFSRHASIKSSVVGGAILQEANDAADAGQAAVAIDKLRTATAVLKINKPVLRRSAAKAKT